MAQFPTSAKVFTPRSNGQTIDAAHVGDLQDEVAAIETGYLDGSARLNSSNSTVANLSVTGGSTFAGSITFGGKIIGSSGLSITGNSTVAAFSAGASTVTTLSVTGNSTFAGDVTIAGTLTGGFPVYSVAVTGTVTPLPNASTTAVTWPEQLHATNSSLHSTATNPERFLPQSSGVWVIGASLRLNSTMNNSTSSFYAWIHDSSGHVLDADAKAGIVGGTSTGFSPILKLEATKYFASVSTQWLRIVAMVADGSTHSLSSSGCFGRFYKL